MTSWKLVLAEATRVREGLTKMIEEQTKAAQATRAARQIITRTNTGK